MIANSKVPANRLVVLTHDRIFRLADHGCTPLLHVYGHRHQFKVSSYRGTTYLNASALDPSLVLVERRNVRPQGGYCRLTIKGDEIDVQRCLLPNP